MGVRKKKQREIMDRKEDKKNAHGMNKQSATMRNANSDTQKRCAESITKASVNWEKNARTTTPGNTAKNGTAVYVTSGTTAR